MPATAAQRHYRDCTPCQVQRKANIIHAALDRARRAPARTDAEAERILINIVREEWYK